jgi:hypothetical protein
MAPSYVCTGDNGSLYDQFHKDVAGSGQLRESARIFEELAQEYNQQKFELQNALSRVTVTYTGAAADQMRGAFQPLIESVGEGFDLCRRSANLLEDQSGGFDAAQAAIQPPVSVPDKPWYNGVVPWDTGHDEAVEKNSGIDAANQQAFLRYVEVTNGNNESAPSFETGIALGIGTVTVTDTQVVDPGGPKGAVPGDGGGPGTGGGTTESAGATGTPNAPTGSETTRPTQAGPPPEGGATRPGSSAPPPGQPAPGGQSGPVGVGAGSLRVAQRGGPADGPDRDGGARRLPRDSGGMVGSRPVDGGRGSGRAAAAQAARSGGVSGVAAGAPLGGGRGGEDEDGEHRSAYLAGRSPVSELIGELPSTPPPVIE